MNAITTSVFDLFSIGPGPSSSHTIGPMRAAYDFLTRVRELPPSELTRAGKLTVQLFGSLSATGDGHGTDKAVLAGLLGYLPESVPQELLDDLLEHPKDTHPLPVEDCRVMLGPQTVIFDNLEHDFPFNNTLVLTLLAGSTPLLTMEYYSTGGGFVQWKGWQEPDLGQPPHPYETMAQLKAQLQAKDLRLHQLILENEKALHGRSEREIYDQLDLIARSMENAVRRGCDTEGKLPGCIGLSRKAPTLVRRAKESEHSADRFLMLLDAYAMAAAEENAAGHVVVTAPTSGSSGVIPSILYALHNHMGSDRQTIREAFLTAAAVGFLVKHNASIAGAEVGCQGEIGTASAMAAAMLAYAKGYRFQVAENAAEIALEHHLGLTCDPVGGYVQIPCIERNAMGAVKAYNAYLMATLGDPTTQIIDLDKAIWTMNQTGRDMHCKYKETSLGGLALNNPKC
ncbi:L-serine ammonia-lyase [Desulfovibrio ferrophilus]|uniref:L-serine dehydratase n=1 Tax=Desulfovibrio ferrophilus TaxID=241368 RepID=A0A2Z6B111_9BACT|nr:L-serine ammonia-lyase [Desulfovibrio ferrophilus]BBD09145.1 L-serine ammonia-lyase [Desulfovibrio ferrophilus]